MLSILRISSIFCEFRQSCEFRQFCEFHQFCVVDLTIFFVILGTHMDVVKDEFPPSFSEYLQQKIRAKFINITDPEKFGLPRVLDSVEVSCKTRQNVRLLANLLYDTAFSLRSPGSTTRLLEQKVPATYLALEEVISSLSGDLRGQGHDPVLRQEQYEAMIINELQSKNLKFRDSGKNTNSIDFDDFDILIVLTIFSILTDFSIFRF